MELKLFGAATLTVYDKIAGKNGLHILRATFISITGRFPTYFWGGVKFFLFQ